MRGLKVCLAPLVIPEGFLDAEPKLINISRWVLHHSMVPWEHLALLAPAAAASVSVDNHPA
jgi:hypothetical protein